MGKPSMFDIEKQLGFYAAYHQHPLNQLIHIICVPVIFWTALVWASIYGGSNLINIDVGFGLLPHPFPVNLAFLVTIIYAGFYIILEPVAGLLYAPILLALCYTANIFAATPGAALTALVIHVVSWILQFLGHGFAEGRAPALLDSLLQALLLAPLFVWLEVLFKVGYRPALHKKIVKSAKDSIADWKKKQPKTKVGGKKKN